MPRYEVTTDQGVFEVELDRAPTDFGELKRLIEQKLAGPVRRTPSVGFADQLPEPAALAPQAPEIPEGAGLADPRLFSQAQGPQAPSLVRRGAEAVGQAVAPSVLPAVGAGLGAATGFPAGLVAAPMGAMAGEVANRALGITTGDLDETAMQVGLTGAATAAIPAGAGGAARAAVGAAKASRPGRLVAQELAVEEAKGLPGRLAIPSAADDLFALARQQNPTISVEPFRAALADFRGRQAITAKAGQQTGPLRLAQQIEALASPRSAHEVTSAAEAAARQGLQSLPPVPKGHVRLYRAERPSGVGPEGADTFAVADQPGLFFSDRPSDAIAFARMIEGESRVAYLDLPVDQATRFKTRPTTAVQGVIPEWVLPEDVAAARTVVPGTVRPTPEEVTFRAEVEARRAADLRASRGQSATPRPHDPMRGGQIPLQTVFENTKAAGRLLRQARQAGSPDAEGYAQVYRAGRETLEAAATKGAAAGEAVGALDAALHAFRREASRDDLADLIADKVLSKPRQGDARVEVRMGALVDALTSNKTQFTQFQADLRKALTPAEYQALVTDVKGLATVKPLPAVAGAERGSGRQLATVAAGIGAGEAVGAAVGLPTGIGGAAGALTAGKTAEIIAESLVNGRARPLLIRMLKANPSLTPRALSILSAAATAQLGSRPQGPRLEP